MKKVAFIGTGNMGGALATAAVAAIGPEEVVLSNRTREKAAQLAAKLGCLAGSNEDAVRSAEYIFLGVKPNMLMGLLDSLAPVLAECHAKGEDKVLVSMAAGVHIADIAARVQSADYAVPVLRIMPNLCVLVDAGVTALCAPEGTPEEYLQTVETVLGNSGKVVRIPEAKIDAFSAVAGCGPAYMYMCLEAMADGGVAAGLTRAEAQQFAALTMMGSAAMVLGTGMHPGALKDNVCSPGGSTIAGVAALERHGFRAALIDAVLAAWEKGKALGKA